MTEHPMDETYAPIPVYPHAELAAPPLPMPENYDPMGTVAPVREDPATVGRLTETDEGPVPTHSLGRDVAGEEARERLLAERAANLDVDDRPHFLRILDDGPELCGQDGEEWPCAAYRRLTEDTSAAVAWDQPGADPAGDLKRFGEEPARRSLEAEPPLVTLDQVAAALGMDRAELETALAANREREEVPPWGVTR